MKNRVRSDKVGSFLMSGVFIVVDEMKEDTDKETGTGSVKLLRETLLKHE